MHLQLLNGLATFVNHIELGSLCCAGRERCLKRCGSSRHRLPLYPEQPFVTGAAAFLHKLDSEEININSPFHSPASGELTVKILPQFNSVTSVLAEPSVIALPEGCVSLSS